MEKLSLTVLISLITLAILVGGGGYYLRTAATDALVREVEMASTSLKQGYTDTVWKKYRQTIVPISGDPSKLQGNAEVTKFAQDTLAYFQSMPLLKVNIYNANGLLLMTQDPLPNMKLAGTASPDKAYVAEHIKLQVNGNSQVLRNVALQNNANATLVQAVFPITLDKVSPAEGGIEIVVDISNSLEAIGKGQAIASIATAGLFLLLLLVFSLNAKKAEAIIAKQHEINLELSQAAEVALAENRDKSQFLTNISHELRTPLNAIIGFSDIIKIELMPKLTERKYDQYINDIHLAGVHLLSLINDILDFSKAEAGKLALEVAEIDANKMVQNCMRLVIPRAEVGNVKLVEAMPKEHVIMVVDSKKFKQVLLNLLSNAVKFTPSGGTVSVSAWHNVVDDMMTFEVQDTGIGIAPKDISRAMSPFGQVDNTLKRKYEGTGLGLPLTKKFVELMGGKFSIESEINKGTKVIFTLPRELRELEGVEIKQLAD